MSNVNRRTRSLAAVAGASLVLGATGVALGGTTLSAGAAAPTGDCATPFPVDEVVEGQQVTGSTVAKGTTPAPFSGEVLGVVEDGIAPGLDMVMVELTSPDIDRVGTIWSGMSGSPVYASDGRLIGAVAYGLAWGPSQVAGVTPYEAMDDYLTGAARTTVRLDKQDAKAVAEAVGVAPAKVTSGFRRLSVPAAVSGFDPARVDKVAKREYLRSPRQAVGGNAAGLGAESLVAGGNLGASVSYGMVTYSGVGTVTSVCGDEVVGFGHPLDYLGKTSVGLHPASAVYVQEDPAGTAFKVANLGAPVGTITDDRRAAISGTVGATPTGTELTSKATFGARSHSGTTTVTVKPYAAEVAWYHVASTNDLAIDGSERGNSLMSWSIKGRDAKGAPFTLSRTDRYLATYDLASEGAGEVPDLVWALSEIPGVTVDSVTTQATLSTDDAAYRVSGVQRRAKGKWVNADGALQVKAGTKVRLRAVLRTGAGATTYRTLTVKVPKRLKGSRLPLFVRGGQRHYAGGGWGSLSGLKTYVAKKVRNDQVVAVLGRDKEATTVTSPAAPNVVSGQKRLRLVVK